MKKPPATDRSLSEIPERSRKALLEFIESAGGTHFYAACAEAKRIMKYKPATLQDAEFKQHYASGYAEGFREALEALVTIAKTQTENDNDKKTPGYSSI